MNCIWFANIRKFCLPVVLAVLTGCVGAECPAGNPTTGSISIKGHVLTVEVAATVAERSCGLSKRPFLAANHGMLFVYPGDRIREFWMKDTLIPLTIAYLNADARILELHTMDPREPDRRYVSRRPAQYALETNLGWFRSRGVQVGDSVDITIN